MSESVADGWLPLSAHEFRSARGRHLYVYGELRGRPGDLPEIDPAALHQRFDLLTGAWVAVSPQRNIRPHSRVAVAGSATARGACPLCPGGPEVAFGYDAAVFDNRYPTFVEGAPAPADRPGIDPGLVARSAGRCEVVLYTERHAGSLATLTPVELARVVAIWRHRTSTLWSVAGHRFVLPFENRGEGVGATLSHPHGQIYAFDRLPPLVEARVDALHRYRTEHGACAGCRVIDLDDHSERIVARNEAFAIAVPFAAHWPYEVHVRARRHGLGRLAELSAPEQRALAAALREVVTRFDGLFGFELPYMMAGLEAPAGEEDWHLAFEFYPPHRTANLAKVRASVETATGLFINDTLPEDTAARLRGLRGPDGEEATAMLVSGPVAQG